MCLHWALQWTSIPSRVYSNLTPVILWFYSAAPCHYQDQVGVNNSDHYCIYSTAQIKKKKTYTQQNKIKMEKNIYENLTDDNIKRWNNSSTAHSGEQTAAKAHLQIPLINCWKKCSSSSCLSSCTWLLMFAKCDEWSYDTAKNKHIRKAVCSWKKKKESENKWEACAKVGMRAKRCRKDG